MNVLKRCRYFDIKCNAFCIFRRALCRREFAWILTGKNLIINCNHIGYSFD